MQNHASETGLDKTTVKRIRSRRVQPSLRSQILLTRFAGAFARQRLAAMVGAPCKVERDDLRVCARYLACGPTP
jgi:hypothetical protein